MREFGIVFTWLTFFLMLYVNYLGGTGLDSLPSVGEISSQYPTLITPAAYAFSIWGGIYLWLFFLVVYQTKLIFSDREEKRPPYRILMGISAANISNGLWIILWVEDQIALAFICLFALLVFLILILRVEEERVSVVSPWMTRFPIQFYLGWVTVALILNAAVLFVKWKIDPMAPEELWAIGVLLAGGVIYVYYALRNWVLTGLSGAWAYLAICANQWGGAESVMMTAGILGIGILVLMFYQWMKSPNPAMARKTLK